MIQVMAPMETMDIFEPCSKTTHPTETEEGEEEVPTEGDTEKTILVADHHVEMTTILSAGRLIIGLETDQVFFFWPL